MPVAVSSVPPPPALPPKQKVIVAVHGIGDQVRNETILSTAIRFCAHYKYQGAISLGAFHGLPPPVTPPQPPPPPEAALFINDPVPFQPCPGLSGVMGFVEVHWADVARRISEEHYTLQETKDWAWTVVNRIRVFATQRNAANANIDYGRIALVLEEIIEAIKVIESLLFLANKAGLGEFDLRKILDGFLGDVQLMAEFAPVRREIVARFSDALAAVGAKYPEAEIHLVSHSEGTVVALLGLLEACSQPAGRGWINQVKGFITLGSPIDKHLILWPRLFDSFEGPHQSVTARIRWVNYVDYSDPIGFNLDTARDWVEKRGYQQILLFDKDDDYSFYRYPVPGKAHVDYWNDPEVFSHFIRKVVDPQPAAAEGKEKPLKKPRSRWWVPVATWVIGYLVPLVLIHLAVYVLCKAIYGYLDPKDGLHPEFVSLVLGLSWLVGGTTVWLRIVRLTRGWIWFVVGLAVYVAAAWGYCHMVNEVAAQGRLEVLNWFEAFTRGCGWPPGMGLLLLSLGFIAAMFVINAGCWRGLYRRMFA